MNRFAYHAKVECNPYAFLGIERGVLLAKIGDIATRFTEEGKILSHPNLLFGVSPVIPLAKDAGFLRRVDGFVSGLVSSHQKRGMFKTVGDMSRKGSLTLAILSGLGILSPSFANFDSTQDLKARDVAIASTAKKIDELTGVDLRAIRQASDPRHAQRKISQIIFSLSLLNISDNFSKFLPSSLFSYQTAAHASTRNDRAIQKLRGADNNFDLHLGKFLNSYQRRRAESLPGTD